MISQYLPPALLHPTFPKLRLVIFSLCLLVVTLLIILAPEQDWLPLEHSSDDLRVALLSDRLPGAHPKIAVITINEETLSYFGVDSQVRPLDREMLRKIIERIDASDALGIGLDIYFARPSREGERDKDEALIKALKDSPKKIVLGVWDERGELIPRQRDFQEDFLRQTGRPAGFLNLRREITDKVVRHHPTPADNGAHPESLSLLLARVVNPKTEPADGRRIAWLKPPRDGTRSAFVTIPAQDLFPARQGAAPVRPGSQLAGRVVLIGADLPALDRHRTPLDDEMAGVFVHAHMLADLLAPERSISEASTGAVRTLLFLLAAAGLLLGWILSKSGLAEMIGWSFATVLLVGINAVAFLYWRTTFPFVLSALTWVVGVTAGRSLYVLTTWLTAQKKAQSST